MFNTIIVELTNFCNMSCDFCAKKASSRNYKNMDWSFFCDIIDEIADKKLARYIQLAGIGESLLYPKLFDAIEYCNNKGLVPRLITNGLTLTTELYRQMISCGLKDLYISLHNLTTESFAHRGAKSKRFEKFYLHIMECLDYHLRNKNTSKLTIALLFLNPHWIESALWDLPAIKYDTVNSRTLLTRFFRDIEFILARNGIKCNVNIDLVFQTVEKLSIFNPVNLCILNNVTLNIVPLNSQLFNTRFALAGKYSQEYKLVRKQHGKCQHLCDPMILSDGSFIPCCLDGLEELVMGKVTNETSIMDILNSDRYQGLVAGFRANNVIYSVCQECMGTLTRSGY